MPRSSGVSVRTKLALSYAGFLLLAGGLLIAVVWVFLLRYVPERAEVITSVPGGSLFIPGRADLWDAFAPRAAWTLFFLLIVGLAGGWFLAGRMLAPLSQIRAATHAAMDGTLSHRIRLPGPRDEFRELADSFDSMLERLEAHVAEQRRFAANASHELRTPLAISQTLLEVARNDPDLDPVHLIDRLHAVNLRAVELTEALLMLSRADQRSFTKEPVDLSLLLDEAAETLLPLAEKRRVRLDIAGEVTSVPGSSALLLQLTINLLHNAIVHNLPDGGAVCATTTGRSGRVELIVENSGEPLAPELVSTLAEPFRRGTDRVRSDQAGAGLGLTIAQSIVRAHDGSLTITGRPDGGLRVAVELPTGGVG